MDFSQMLGSADCPFEFTLGLKEKSTFPGKPPYPELRVISNKTEHVREVRWQQVVFKAHVPETGKTENVKMMRLVAVLEGGQEMELSRHAVPVEPDEIKKGDPTRCAACYRRIPHGAGVEDNGLFYHRLTCWQE